MANDCLDDLIGDPASIHRFKEGRVCRMHGCKTPLSIYNPNQYCFKHTKERLLKLNEEKNSSLHWSRPSVYGQKCEVVK